MSSNRPLGRRQQSILADMDAGAFIVCSTDVKESVRGRTISARAVRQNFLLRTDGTWEQLRDDEVCRLYDRGEIVGDMPDAGLFKEPQASILRRAS